MSPISGGTVAKGRGVWDKDPDERRKLADALLDRPDRYRQGIQAIQRLHPNAPEEMVRIAAHHLFLDGPIAAVDWLASAEMFLRRPEHGLELGSVIHLIDHAYNWLQLQALLPEGRDEILELTTQIRDLAAQGDLEGVRATVNELEENLTGNRSAPDFL
jgi:hypothetical protein